MRLLERILFERPAAIDAVIKVIVAWTPGNLRTERAYEGSLYAYLHACLADVQVTRQYAIGRVRTDIMVGDRVLIEIKKDLDTVGKYHRLLGQIADFADWGGDLVVVLCGFTDPHLRKQLDHHLQKGTLDPRRRVRVVDRIGEGLRRQISGAL